MTSNVKEERAAKAISELNDLLAEARNERKDLEIEYITVKKNYFQVSKQLDQEKSKSENLSVELINLVNENKSLQRDVALRSSTLDEKNQGRALVEEKAMNLEK